MSSGKSDNEKFAELKDPRTKIGRVLKPSSELISDYGYSSRLTISEQKRLLNSLCLQINHNPNLLKNECHQSYRQQLVSQKQNESTLVKLKTEAVYFNKFTEIFFHRNPLSNVLSDQMKTYLISRWSAIESIEDDNRFQMITTIFKDQVCKEITRLKLQDTLKDDFIHEAFLISKEHFPSLDRFSCEDLKLRYYPKSTDSIEEPPECDVVLSLDVLAKLVAKDEQFTVRVENRMNSMGSTCTTFKTPLPLKQVSLSKALEEIVLDILNLSIDWCNMDRLVKQSAEDFKSFHPELIENVMRKSYAKFQHAAGMNEIQRMWKLTNGAQSLKVLVNQSDVCFIRREDNVLISVNVSVKLEYQTKFGAERMTRDELLREWAKQKFNPESLTLRFRIDASSLTILSISCISTKEIEEELNKHYSSNPNDSSVLGNLVTVFTCFQRSPVGNYNIQTNIDDSGSKLHIYKSCEHGISLTNKTWEFSELSSRKWIPIDESTPTFLHRNHQFSPCCFPYIAGKRQLSYLNNIQAKKGESQLKKTAEKKVKPLKLKKRRKPKNCMKTKSLNQKIS